MRQLDPIEIRVLGGLMEKQQTTPEYYPLTLNALVAACNQKSNREPVMELAESDVDQALGRLQDEKLVWRVLGGRSTRWDHNLDGAWQLDRGAKSLLAVLFLRGAQTAGELRIRTERMAHFESIEEVESLLRVLSTREQPLVRELPRRPGQKENRWVQVLGAAVAEEEPAVDRASDSAPSGQPLSVRVQHLEEQLAALSEEFERLKRKLGE